MKRYFFISILAILLGIISYYILSSNYFQIQAKEKYVISLVQIGAFQNYDNATKMADQYNSYVYENNDIYYVYYKIYLNKDINYIYDDLSDLDIPYIIKNNNIDNKFYNKIKDNFTLQSYFSYLN
jgi:type II secretory pathway pseudopilin PulG